MGGHIPSFGRRGFKVKLGVVLLFGCGVWIVQLDGLEETEGGIDVGSRVAVRGLGKMGRVGTLHDWTKDRRLEGYGA